jgi:hypothetical protein
MGTSDVVVAEGVLRRAGGGLRHEEGEEHP